jgi:hypothetical protein
MNTPRFTAPAPGPNVRVSKVEGHSERFARIHDAFRYYRAKGLSKIEALQTVRQFHPELNRAYCIAQENGEAWTREPLDTKHYTAEQLRGRLS